MAERNQRTQLAVMRTIHNSAILFEFYSLKRHIPSSRPQVLRLVLTAIRMEITSVVTHIMATVEPTSAPTMSSAMIYSLIAANKAMIFATYARNNSNPQDSKNSVRSSVFCR